MGSDRTPDAGGPSPLYLAGHRIRQEAGDDREAELMRLSMEPMYLHAFLHRDSPTAIDRPLNINLLPLIELAGEGDPLSHTCSPRYVQLEPVNTPSLEPETFIPREEDRELAIDGGEQPRSRDFPWKPLVIAALAMGWALLILLVV